MSRAAIVEEVADSDLSDPSEGNISDFEDTDIIRRVDPPSRPVAAAAAAANPTLLPSNAVPQPHDRSHFHGGDRPRNFPSTDSFNAAHMLYPIYFDVRRTRAEGRRVPKHLAVENPLARTIAEACSALRLQPLLEPSKIHPGDWANPGRVRVKYPPAQVRMGAPNILNKHHLFTLVAQFLKEVPTTEQCEELRVGIPGLPLAMPKAGEPWPRPAVPRGWKMGELVPLLSPAMTGGGVSENLIKDVMKEMQGGGNPMAALMGGPGGAFGEGSGVAEEGGKKKKDKKKK